MGRDSFAQAFSVVREYRLRSFLAALAMAAAVTALAGISTGLDALQAFAQRSTARSVGADVFTLTKVGQRSRLGRRELARKLERNIGIDRADARFLDSMAGGVVVYAPSAQRIADATSTFGKVESIAVTGTTEAITRIRDLALAEGRMFSADEARRGEAVGVIGEEIRAALFPNGRALGSTVRVAGRAFRVIGVQEPLGQLGGQSQDRYLWIPLSSFERIYGVSNNLQVFAKAEGDASLDATQAELAAEDRARTSLRAKRNLFPGRPDNFDVVTPEAARGFVARLSGALRAAAVPISLMALLAAIVVIANTALVSVAQRTREIGIRRAIGARAGAIQAEVLAESLIVSAVGAMAGLAFVATTTTLLAQGLDLDLPLQPAVLGRSMILAIVSGFLAGYLPARRAARSDVLTALRAE